jgi:hypothetical protein
MLALETGLPRMNFTSRALRGQFETNISAEVVHRVTTRGNHDGKSAQLLTTLE